MCSRYTTTPRAPGLARDRVRAGSTTGRIRTRETTVLETARAPGAPVVWLGGEQPVRESNPRLRLERAVSSAARRTGRRARTHETEPDPVEWAVWRSNPRLHVFSVALDHLSYRPGMPRARWGSPGPGGWTQERPGPRSRPRLRAERQTLPTEEREAIAAHSRFRDRLRVRRGRPHDRSPGNLRGLRDRQPRPSPFIPSDARYRDDVRASGRFSRGASRDPRARTEPCRPDGLSVAPSAC